MKETLTNLAQDIRRTDFHSGTHEALERQNEDERTGDPAMTGSDRHTD